MDKLRFSEDTITIPPHSRLNSDTLFPIELLPGWMQEVVEECTLSYGTPAELWASAFLSGIASASGKRFKLFTGNYTNYPQLWVIVLGTSGTGKSEPFKLAMRPIEEYDKGSYILYQMEHQEWEVNKKIGVEPTWKQSIIGDTTPEALFAVLKDADNGLSLYRDELSGFFQDIGRYNKSGEVGHYLSIFDNASFPINRKTQKPLLITDPSLNIFGTIQPSVLKNVLNDSDADASGFAQRFLYLYPDFPIKNYNPDQVKLETYNKYVSNIQGIQKLEKQPDRYLTAEAESFYSDFYNELELLRHNANEFWASVYSKAQIQVLRLALTIHIARLSESNSDSVEAKDMQCAIGMTRYFNESLKKFRDETKEVKPLKAVDIIKEIFKLIPDANQTRVAEIFNVTQPYINRIKNS